MIGAMWIDSKTARFRFAKMDTHTDASTSAYTHQHMQIGMYKSACTNQHVQISMYKSECTNQHTRSSIRE
ncbi:hypothetical protein POVWA2_052350 [Plasmodium ovale wallikeri]|uniref:Uncharacterized protein n=1 Tax=Plasmodium ovale wallikeri TaxID=864142 RepID=A0A1A8ZQB0_PLAOA|nr:hypothetical protein POVWA1_053080 [Plasmodium ovale wallikeri]SBT46614.1 hypothetical protein POVWA2_052350 [Plasmodium ovale wallikeri]